MEQNHKKLLTCYEVGAGGDQEQKYLLENNYQAYLLPGVSKAYRGLSGFPRKRTFAYNSVPVSLSLIVELEACGRVTSAPLRK